MYEPSPFPYQGPLQPDQVRGRDELIRDLAERLMSRRVTALLGPRRFGKTSVLKKVATDLAQVGPDTVWIDLYQLNSMADLAAALDRGLAAATGPARAVLDSIAAGMSLNLGFVSVELARSRRERPDATTTVRSLMQLIVRTAERRPLTLIFDEFSGISGVEGGAGLLRTELQHHYQQIGIMFAGSEQATMRTLFTDQAEPFFAQADIVEIEPLTIADSLDIVRRGFKSTKRSAGTTAALIANFAAGHPQRFMQLSDAVWRHTEPGETATAATWEAGLASVRSSVDIGSERLYALLPHGHQKTLRVIASGGSIFGTAAELVDLPPGTAQGAVAALLGNGFLIETAEGVQVVDPLFADWLRRRFPR